MLEQGNIGEVDIQCYYCDKLQHQEINCKDIFENAKENIAEDNGSDDESIAELGLLVLREGI